MYLVFFKIKTITIVVGLYIFLKTIGPHNVLDMIMALFDINTKVSW